MSKEVSWIPLAESKSSSVLGLDQCFRTKEAFGANSDDVPVWETVGLRLVLRQARDGAAHSIHQHHCFPIPAQTTTAEETHDDTALESYDTAECHNVD